MSTPPIASPDSEATPLPDSSKYRGRWKWAFGILLVAWVAQGLLWAVWWEDPTHFKMSILFVWPAALFSLAIWWIFFSGWSRLVRLGSVGVIAAAFVGFLSLYRLEVDGDMIPRRIILRSKPSAEEIARNFFKNQTSDSVETVSPKDPSTVTEETRLVAVDGDWTGFRGPRRDGIVRGGSLRRNWSAAPPREIWRHPVGRAWSSFAVVENYVFTQEQRDTHECVVAYDAATGKQKWVHQDVALLSIVDLNGGPGPHATPEFDIGLIYTLGGTGLLNCLDASTGRSEWMKDIVKDAGDEKNPVKPPEWGFSGSPLIVDDLVIVNPGIPATPSGAVQNKSVIAYNKKSGEPVWAAGNHPASYGSPRVETLLGTRQVLIPNGNGLSSHALDDGRELWFFPLANSPKVNSAMPWVLEQRSVLFGTGYGVGSVRIEIKLDQEHWDASLGWASNRFRPKFNDFIVTEGFAYGLDDGTLTCFDIESGKIQWKSERCGYGQILLIEDLLLIITENGDLKLVPAKPKKPEVLATFKVFDVDETGFCWNHLAFVRGRLYARNANEAACFDISSDTQRE